MCAHRGTEHIIMLLPFRASFKLGLQLTNTMLFECLKYELRKKNTAAALLRLWLCFHIRCSLRFLHLCGYARQDTTYLEHICLEIKILPLEAEQFSSPHASCQSKYKQCFQTMITSCSQELLNLFHTQGLDFKALSARRRNEIAHVT